MLHDEQLVNTTITVPCLEGIKYYIEVVYAEKELQLKKTIPLKNRIGVLETLDFLLICGKRKRLFQNIANQIIKDNLLETSDIEDVDETWMTLRTRQHVLLNLFMMTTKTIELRICEVFNTKKVLPYELLETSKHIIQ